MSFIIFIREPDDDFGFFMIDLLDIRLTEFYIALYSFGRLKLLLDIYLM